MGSAQAKRKLAASAINPPSKKRKTAKLPNLKEKAKRLVNVNNLPWQTVDVPEMFDDAEGFFGLEEISGVDVVRQGDKVQFLASVSAEEESEFEGFDDASIEEPSSVEAPEITSEAKTGGIAAVKDDTRPALAATKKQKSAVPASEEQDSELETGTFSSLRDFDGAENAIEETDMFAWVSLELSPEMLSSIARLKFSTPTAIQSAAIPQILSGVDVIGKASTGSGKTLAFAVPIVEHWLANHDRSEARRAHPTALILSPTRELAHQITNHIKELCLDLTSSPYICSVTGGLAVQKQQRQLEKADIVIATPGRLWEVLSSSTTLLKGFRDINFLVVDEADRILTEGHFKDAEEIFNALDRPEIDGDKADDKQASRKRQTLVFSATFNKGLQQKLAGKGRYDLLDQAQSMEYLLKKMNFRGRPKFVDVNPVSQMADRLKEGLVECGPMEKDLYLYAVLLLQSTSRALVFTNSISSVRRLAPLLQNLGLPALALHSEMAQKARLRAIERFTAAKTNKGVGSILVATDVAARGLDIPGIELVVHYHVPRTADAYVHRSGRTARAEHSGVSVLLCAPEEVTPTRRLVAKVHAASASKAARSAAERSKQTQSSDFFIQTADIDRKLVSRLRERVVLAKKIADAALAKEKGGKEENWLKTAAEELGVEYDSDELENVGKWSGKGSGRKKKEKEARQLTKAEIAAMKAELRDLLSKRVNAGTSENYITNGKVDIGELLKGADGQFLGKVDGLGLDGP